ncbi:hypothetical protein QM012_004127 [Aureobasidium pullulans]|uniref:Uncharacterized protein n=1 Tax=Aureobasidium pullulans TaxID=5580 RepID=A0ABR0T6R4_AURPU
MLPAIGGALADEGVITDWSCHNLAKQDPSSGTGSGKYNNTADANQETLEDVVNKQNVEPGVHPTHSSNGQSIEESTTSEPRASASIETSPSDADINPDEESPVETTQFSASLADGTIVYLDNSLIDLSHFKDLVLTVSKIWKQHSVKVASWLSAQNIAIRIHTGVRHKAHRKNLLHTVIYDAGAGRNPRKLLLCTWNLSANHSKSSLLTVRNIKGPAGSKGIRAGLMRALQNHIGSLNSYGLLVMPPSLATHALYFQYKEYDTMFESDRAGSRDRNFMSTVLGENILLSQIPEPVTQITEKELLSLSIPIWQWWRSEQMSVGKEPLEGITHIRIIETNSVKNSLRVEVWRISRVRDAKLIKSIHNISFSDAKNSIASSVTEFKHEMERLRPGSDFETRYHARASLNRNVGWINSEGHLTEGEYPKLESMIDNLGKIELSSIHPRPFLSPKTSTSPKPQTISRDKDSKLNEIPGQEATTKELRRSRDDDSICKEVRYRNVSATLHDGSLVIINFKVGHSTENKRGKSFSSILRVISQWRMQARDDFDHQFLRKPLLVYVTLEASESSVDVQVLRKEPDWFEKPIIHYRLHHTLQESGCSYVNFEPLPQTVLDHHQWMSRNKKLLNIFRSGLKRYIGSVDKAGVLCRSAQPPIDQFLSDLRKPTTRDLGAGTEATESPMAVGQAKNSHKKAQGASNTEPRNKRKNGEDDEFSIFAI